MAALTTDASVLYRLNKPIDPRYLDPHHDRRQGENAEFDPLDAPVVVFPLIGHPGAAIESQAPMKGKGRLDDQVRGAAAGLAGPAVKTGTGDTSSGVTLGAAAGKDQYCEWQ